MWFRALCISFLKWMAFWVITSILLRFVLTFLSGWWLAVPMWVAAFGNAFLFADWMLSKQTLSNRELAAFIVIWMIVTLTLQLLYTQFLTGDVRYALNSPELYVQYTVELLAIFLAASYARKKRMQSVLGEGMTA